MAKKQAKNQNQPKTNAMRLLEQHGVSYTPHYYEQTGAVSGVDVAAALGQDPAKVFKTLVTEGKSGEHYVFIIPVANELDLKKAAKAVGEKSIAMIRSRELLPLTGYIHGGCSPIGMKKFFTTTMDESAILQETVCVSGGRIGFQVELTVDDLSSVIELDFADLTV